LLTTFFTFRKNNVEQTIEIYYSLIVIHDHNLFESGLTSSKISIIQLLGQEILYKEQLDFICLKKKELYRTFTGAYAKVNMALQLFALFSASSFLPLTPAMLLPLAN
jgi:hypothetical protein